MAYKKRFTGNSILQLRWRIQQYLPFTKLDIVFAGGGHVLLKGEVYTEAEANKTWRPCLRQALARYLWASRLAAKLKELGFLKSRYRLGCDSGGMLLDARAEWSTGIPLKRLGQLDRSIKFLRSKLHTDNLPD